jgi:hypothetical protein
MRMPREAGRWPSDERGQRDLYAARDKKDKRGDSTQEKEPETRESHPCGKRPDNSWYRLKFTQSGSILDRRYMILANSGCQSDLFDVAQ